ncbi:putative ribonuclease H-like domain-containing protein [Tanacetum coccineum]
MESKQELPTLLPTGSSMDLYNNFKIVEQDVKKSVGASSGAQNLAFMTTPSTSSTNDVNTANPAYEVSIVSLNINTTCSQVSTANFSDNTMYAFMLSLLSIRAKRYFQRTRKKIFINANDTAGTEWKQRRSDQNQDNTQKMNNTSKQGNNEDTSQRQCLAINGIVIEGSDMAQEQVQTNIALMTFSDSELNQTEFTAATYKRGLATVEEQLITYRKNEVLFSEEVTVLKREVACKDYEINVLKNHKFKSYGSKDSKLESNIVCDTKSDDSKENFDDSLVKEHVSEDTSSFVKSPLNVDKEIVFLVDKKKSSANPKIMKNHGCSRHMTGNIAYLSDFKEFDGGYVTFGGGAHGGRISSKGTLKTDSLDFEDLPDESHILLKIPRKDNMYSFDMKNIVPKESLTCLVAKATSDESMLWHRRLGHINFKNINKLVKDNLVRGLPTKHFENDQTCDAYLKWKQHKAFLEKGIKREYSVARTP